MSERLSQVLAGLVASWMHRAGSYVSLEVRPSELACMGDHAQAGVLAAAIELRQTLSKFSEGRQALRDLGFEPFAQDVERE